MEVHPRIQSGSGPRTSCRDGVLALLDAVSLMKCCGSLAGRTNEGKEKRVRFMLWPPYSKSIVRQKRADIEKVYRPNEKRANSMDMQEDLPCAGSGGGGSFTMRFVATICGAEQEGDRSSARAKFQIGASCIHTDGLCVLCTAQARLK